MKFAKNRICFLKNYHFHKPCGVKWFGCKEVKLYLCTQQAHPASRQISALRVSLLSN